MALQEATNSGDNSRWWSLGGRGRLHPLKMFWPMVVRYKVRAGLALIALLAASVATLVVPIMIRRVIDAGFIMGNVDYINHSFFTLTIVVGVLAVASASRYYLVTWLGERIVSDLRGTVFHHLVRLDMAFFDSARSGELMSRLTADATQIKAAVSTSVSIALRNMLLFWGAVIMMVVTNPRLSLFVLIVLPLIMVPLVLFGWRVRKKTRLAQDHLANASAYGGEMLSAVRAVQAFTNEHFVATRFINAVEGAFQAARLSIMARAFLTAFAIFLAFSSVVVVLWIGAQDVLSGRITAGELGQFVLYCVFAAGALGGLSEVWGEISQATGAAERLAELLHHKPSIVAPPQLSCLPQMAEGRIAFDRVSFHYPAAVDRAVLQDVSFTISPGETIALVGPSGAGKSTLFQLLMRFYDPVVGIIQLDGVSLSTLDPIALRGQFAMVPQETAIFSGSIRENIAFGYPEASEAAIMEVAKAARVDQFVEAMDQGYETHVGERGVTLSGGQRQRIAIARALLRDAPILLLDEATSALDAESETYVQAALETLKKGRTTLIIAHRLATVLNVDRILVMDGGELVEEGSHEALLAANGLYARLARLQFDV